MTGSEERWRRDLRWCIESPLLIDPPGEGGVDPGELELGRDEGAAGGYQAFSGHRVGYYFESLVAHWLGDVRQVEMVAQGHQVVEGGRTLGEIDFVFRDEAGVLNHWEVAAKFFLYSEHHEVLGSHFIGPNAGDTFERKRDKLLGQQLELSRSVFPEVGRRVAFVKGRIFYHPEEQHPDELPGTMAGNHLRGTWIRFGELDWLAAVAERFCILEKPHWLAPERLGHDDPRLLQAPELVGRLRAGDDRPVLLAGLAEDRDTWRETERIFVVSDDWPAGGTPPRI